MIQHQLEQLIECENGSMGRGELKERKGEEEDSTIEEENRKKEEEWERGGISP